jgi:membrane-associated phospholipid phosphatase
MDVFDLRRGACVVLLGWLLLCGPGAGAAAGQGPVYRSAPASHAPWLLAGGALAVVGRQIQARLEPLPALERAALHPGDLWALDRPWAGRWSPASGRGSDLLLAGALLLYPTTWLSTRRHQEDAAVMLMGIQTVLITQGAVMLTKGLTGRFRPWAYLPGNPTEGHLPAEARRSFPSGHTAHAFAAVSFALTVRRDLGAVPGMPRAVPWLLLAGATSTAVLRVTAGEHFPTDVAAAAVLGALVGNLVPGIHRQAESSGPAFSLILASPQGVMVRFHF